MEPVAEAMLAPVPFGNILFDKATGKEVEGSDVAMEVAIDAAVTVIPGGKIVKGVTKGLGNPFKTQTLKQVEKAFQKHVKSGKLEVVYKNAENGGTIYKNNKSGYSYYLDPGIKEGKIVEPPHIDVNYAKPKPKHLDKKKLPVAGGF